MVELAADLGHRALHRPLLDVVVRRRPDRDVLEVVDDQLAGQRVEVLEALDLVAEQDRPERRLRVRGEDLQRVAADAERPAPERGVVAVVLEVDELAQELVAVDVGALDQRLQVVVVGVRRAEAEDRRHRGDDQHVAAREQRGRRGVAQAVDLLVDRRVLLDVEVARGDVGLGLVVVVVGDEVLDGVLREVGAELVAELRGERLVVHEDQRRLLQPLDRRRHRHRLAGAGGAQQRRVAVALVDALRDRVDRRGLIGGRAVDAVELEGRHEPTNSMEGAGRTASARHLQARLRPFGDHRGAAEHEPGAERGRGEGGVERVRRALRQLRRDAGQRDRARRRPPA